MVWKPHATVATVVQRGRHYLLVEELVDGDRSVWNQPAGHIEDRESIEAAAVRETLEETGFLVRPTGLIGIHQWRNPATSETMMRFVLRAEIERELSGHALDDGILGPIWKTWDEINASDAPLRSPLVRLAILDAIDQHLPLQALRQL